jgi:hypothetical protein
MDAREKMNALMDGLGIGEITALDMLSGSGEITEMEASEIEAEVVESEGL